MELTVDAETYAALLAVLGEANALMAADSASEQNACIVNLGGLAHDANQLLRRSAA